MNGPGQPVGSILQQLVSRVESEPDREVCGFVLGGTAQRPPEIVALRNTAVDPARAFRMAPGDVLGVLRREPAVAKLSMPKELRAALRMRKTA